MLFSLERKFCFIATPKTGTTSIEARLMELDPRILKDKLVDQYGNIVSVSKHTTAAQAKKIIGPECGSYTYISFLRDPRQLAYSKYNFYRNGWPYKKWKTGELPFLNKVEISWYRPSLVHRVLVSRLLPLNLWVLFYPFKPNAHFVTGSDDKLIVDKLGLFENLEEDFINIFKQFGFSNDDLVLPHMNKVEGDLVFSGKGFIEKIMQVKLRKDLRLYDNARLWRSEKY
jgi:hypothetical protein